jgi:hypothetical protein
VTEDHDDFDFEPVRGLPGPLPEGERMLWQGAPDWRALAVEAFHVRKVALYFVLLVAWQAAGAEPGQTTAELAASAGWTAGAGAIAIAILCGLAWLYGRTTVYTLTTRRVVIRSGLALPVTMNLPLSLIESAAVTRRGASGGIALKVTPPNRIALLAMWPNARPWAFTNPQPMLRALRDVDAVLPLLTAALGRSAPKTAKAAEPEVMPAGAAGLAA